MSSDSKDLGEKSHLHARRVETGVVILQDNVSVSKLLKMFEVYILPLKLIKKIK